jgi:hypothetical protein
MIEDYQSLDTESAKELRLLALIWWDATASAYRATFCYNADSPPCVEGISARWQGGDLVFTWSGKDGANQIDLRDAYIHITPESFQNAAEVSVNGGPVTRHATTTWARKPSGRKN